MRNLGICEELQDPVSGPAAAGNLMAFAAW
jgi:hypothetical protein